MNMIGFHWTKPCTVCMYLFKSSSSVLWDLLDEGNEIKFHDLAFSEQRSGDFWNKDNGNKTFLQHACYEEQVS